MTRPTRHHDPASLQRRRELRQRSTKPEQLIWAALRNRRLQGLKFRRQHSVGEFIVDFVCLEKKLVVEVDGGYHDYVPDKDIRRQRYLESQGYRVIRFWNEDVLEDVDAVVRAIAQAAGLPPHPSPLPQRVAGDVDGPLRA